MRGPWFLAMMLACRSAGQPVDLPSASPPPAVEDAGVAPSEVDVRTASLEELATEYASLRKIHGHMSGAPGSWIDDVDSFGGRKHRVMAELGSRLDGGVSRTRLVALIGEPDGTAHEGDDGWLAMARRSPGGKEATEMLVYEWRGRHDFLFFAARDRQITGSGWWMAGE
jgi:hypothetical protein